MKIPEGGFVPVEPLWERQPWETATAFDRFQRYYFTQPTPRSLVAAFRAGVPPKVKKGSAKAGQRQDKREPSTAWKNWHGGKSPKGKKYPGALTWPQRMEAWDKDVMRQTAEEEREKTRKRIKRLRKMWDDLYKKTEVAITSYQPGSEKLTDITKAMEQLIKMGSHIYGIPQEPITFILGEGVDFENVPSMMSAGEKVDRLRAIFEAAKARDEATRSSGESSPD